MEMLRDWRKGDQVKTPYGEGVVFDVAFPTIQMNCEEGKREPPRLSIVLAFGNLYTLPSVNRIHRIRTLKEIDQDLDAFEEGRRLKLEMACADLGIDCDHSVCTICLLHKDNMRSSSMLHNSSNGKMVGTCIACGAPSCRRHSVKELRKENVVVCSDCEDLFHRRIDPGDAMLVKKVESALQMYKRSYLLLESMASGVTELVCKLHEVSAQNTKVDFGSSSVSFLSSAMGLAGAATILTPAGPPMLLAATILGASAITTRVSYSIGKRFREEKPSTLANSIIATFGILRSILSMLSVLVDEANSDATKTKIKLPSLANKGFEAAKAANTGLQVGANVGVTQSASVFQYLGASPVIGQVFSLAAMTVDLNTVNRTLAKMRSGSRSEKADKIEQLMVHEFANLPSFTEVSFAAHELLSTQ